MTKDRMQLALSEKDTRDLIHALFCAREWNVTMIDAVMEPISSPGGLVTSYKPMSGHGQWVRRWRGESRRWGILEKRLRKLLKKGNDRG